MKNILFAACCILGGFLSRCSIADEGFEFPEAITQITGNPARPDTLIAFRAYGDIHIRFLRNGSFPIEKHKHETALEPLSKEDSIRQSYSNKQ